MMPEGAKIFCYGIIVGIVFGSGMMALFSCHSYDVGYQAAYTDMKNGRIECVMSVRYPEWTQ